MKYAARLAILVFSVIGAALMTYPLVNGRVPEYERSWCQLALGLTTIAGLLPAAWQRRRR